MNDARVDPRPFCDLVMKGGVTSGIVYPAAIYEIARVFDLKSIGGTSAGAIAAALAAAAQYRRVRATAAADADLGYERLRDLPGVLGQDHRLFRLFAPNAMTRALFRIVVDLFAPKTPLFAKLTTLTRAYPLQSAIGLVPAVCYALATRTIGDASLRLGSWIVVLLVAAIGAIAGAVVGLLIDILRKLPKNYFGLVTGIDDTSAHSELALCTWLTGEIEATAGLPPGQAPLTFGMLWNPTGSPSAVGLEDAPPAEQRAVNLQMVTTCLTEGRPYQFPTRTNRFHFSVAELSAFFPPHVVKWMCDHSRAGATTHEGLVPLPPISDLPIIVATRMSLSFPILLSAVPLHAVDYTDLEPAQPQGVWFSDGGLSSNFPITMFDAPLPAWPTLALNLGAFGPRTPANGIVMAVTTGAGRNLRFNKISSVQTFLLAIFGALQNWNDNMQATIPGFRDRIVTIAMSPDEGGLNLDMDSSTIERLRDRGVAAGKALLDRFEPPSTLAPGAPIMSWEGHRWTRLRMELDVLRRHLTRFAGVYKNPGRAGDVSFSQLILTNDPETIPLRSYPLADGPQGRVSANTLTGNTSQVGAAYDGEASIQDGIPAPAPSLVIRPDLDK